MRVKLAQVLIRDCQRPVAALRVLDEIPAGSLPADLEAARQKLAAKAQQMLEEGVLEIGRRRLTENLRLMPKTNKPSGTVDGLGVTRCVRV